MTFNRDLCVALKSGGHAELQAFAAKYLTQQQLALLEITDPQEIALRVYRIQGAQHLLNALEEHLDNIPTDEITL